MNKQEKCAQITTDDVIAFLLNAYFGSITEPVYVAANSAYLDVNRTIEFKTAGTLSKENKEQMRRESVSLIKSGIESLCGIATIRQDTFDELHTKLCRQVVETYEKGGVVFHYGQAQKWVNMAFKYLTVIKREATAGILEFLHVPIDSVILDIASKEFVMNRPDHRWSRMNEQEYKDCQGQLRTNILKTTGYAPMVWEFNNWNR